jgi:Cu(I)-responsive transcriptional regulator
MITQALDELSPASGIARRHVGGRERDLHPACAAAGGGRSHAMNIGEVARRAGLPAKTIRYYEAIGLVVPSARSANGYRDHSEQDLRLLQFVARARSLGFPIEDCRDLLGLYRDQHRASADVKALALARVAETERKIRELAAMKATLEDLVNRCHGDQRPDCPILNDLAEPADPGPPPPHRPERRPR